MKVLVALLLPGLLCSCSSSYIFRQPYEDVVDTTLEQCRQHQKRTMAPNARRGPSMTYSGRADDGRYEVQIVELYGLTRTRVWIKAKGDQRTKVSVRSLRVQLNSNERDEDNEQIWLYRIGTALKERPPSDGESYQVEPEK